jgi:hypothetical protein
VTEEAGELQATFTRAWQPIDAQHAPLDVGLLQLLVARAGKPSLDTYHHSQRAVVAEPLDLGLASTPGGGGEHNCSLHRDGHQLWFLPFVEHPSLPNTNVWLGWSHQCHNMTTKFTLVAHTLGWLGNCLFVLRLCLVLQ